MLIVLLEVLAMMAATVRLSSKGQIVIPKEVRDSLHWDVGVELILVTTWSYAKSQNSQTAQTTSPIIAGIFTI